MLYGAGVFVIILQIIAAVHAVRTGRSLTWVFIILFFPLVGSLIYLIAEVVPELERRNAFGDLGAEIDRFLSRLFGR